VLRALLDPAVLRAVAGADVAEMNYAVFVRILVDIGGGRRSGNTEHGNGGYEYCAMLHRYPRVLTKGDDFEHMALLYNNKTGFCQWILADPAALAILVGFLH
jgi:hypothetical protein